MAGLDGIGRLLSVAGGLIARLGLILIFADRISLLGRLPGDFSFRTDDVRAYFPPPPCSSSALSLPLSST